MKVKVRSATTTEVPSSSKELADQIARLMAALTRAEQGSCPASAPNSPKHRSPGRGQTDKNMPVHPSSHNGWTGLGQTTSVHSSSITNRGGVESPHKGNWQVQNGVQGGTQSNQGSNSAVFQVPGLGPHDQGVHDSSHTIKQGRGNLRECGQTPLQQSTISSKHSLCDPKPKLTQDKAGNKRGWKGITPIPFLNPDLVA